MKKDYKELTKIMKKCTDLDLLIYREAVALGVVTCESIETGERKEEYNLELFDCLTIELVYRGIL